MEYTRGTSSPRTRIVSSTTTITETRMNPGNTRGGMQSPQRLGVMPLPRPSAVYPRIPADYDSFAVPIMADSTRHNIDDVRKNLFMNKSYPESTYTQQTSVSPKREQPKTESLIEWFDRTVEKELLKRRDDSLSPAENILDPTQGGFSPSRIPLNISKSKGLLHPQVVVSSTSGVDIEAGMRGEQNTDLLDAVDKLAKAEAMCVFAGAVEAAEQAAAAAPPEYAEEAAAAGARGFQAEVTNIVKEFVPGLRPVEVVGYVGITRPKQPKKP